jgi:hypothetical protein
LQQGFQTPSHQERTKDTKKDYCFLRELSVYLVFAERRIPANWRVILVLSNLFAAMLRYNITSKVFVFLAKKSSNTKAPRNHKEHKGRLR